MNLGDNYQADKDVLDVIQHPLRLQPENISAFTEAISTLLYDAMRSGADLRIAQIIGNFGDCYYMEDAEYVALVWEACD